MVEFLGGALLNPGANDQGIDIEPQDYAGLIPLQEPLVASSYLHPEPPEAAGTARRAGEHDDVRRQFAHPLPEAGAAAGVVDDYDDPRPVKVVKRAGQSVKDRLGIVRSYRQDHSNSLMFPQRYDPPLIHRAAAINIST